MKTIHKHLVLVSIVLIFISCSKDEEPQVDPTSENEIENFVTPDLLNAMQDLGFIVNPGTNPPNVEGAFLVSPMSLIDTSVPNDPGFFFAPLTFTFSNQNQEASTIEYEGANGNESSAGLGSLITGSDNKFTVFLKLETVHDEGDTAINIRAISGEISEDGIIDFQLAGFMLDNHGNPNENWIPNNTGRLFEDGDGLAQRQ